MADWMRDLFNSEVQRRQERASPLFQAGLAGVMEDLKNWRGVQQWEADKAIDQGFDEARQGGEFAFSDPVGAREAYDFWGGVGPGDVGMVGTIKQPGKASKTLDMFNQFEDEPYLGASGGFDDLYTKSVRNDNYDVRYSPEGDIRMEVIENDDLFPSDPGHRGVPTGYSVTLKEAKRLEKEGFPIWRFPTRGPDTTGEQGWFSTRIPTSEEGTPLYGRDLVRPTGKGSHFRHYVRKGFNQPDDLWSALLAAGLGGVLLDESGNGSGQ
jgi:hypothetical protein